MAAWTARFAPIDNGRNTHKFTQVKVPSEKIQVLASLHQTKRSGSKDHIVKCKLLEELQAIVFN